MGGRLREARSEAAVCADSGVVCATGGEIRGRRPQAAAACWFERRRAGWGQVLGPADEVLVPGSLLGSVH